MYANPQALGRNHQTADRASITEFTDCVRVDLDWNDGGHVHAMYDTKGEAIAHLAALGFAPA